MANFYRRTSCRLCDGSDLELAISMKPSPVGDAFVKDRRSEQELFPLDVYRCAQCTHLQNLDVVDPEILFGNYTYQTAHSSGLVEHFRKYATHVMAKLGIDKPIFVLEIGSNDGSLLSQFQQLGCIVQGVDASSAVAEHANQRGVPTIADFFTLGLSESITRERGQAGLVCANNVYAHVDDLHGMTAGIKHALADDGVFVFEVSYLPDMVENMVFDTIYHEHVSYHTLHPLERFFNSHNMTLFDVERIATKGGSVRAFVQIRSTGRRQRTEALAALMAEEVSRQYDRIETYRRYAEKIVDYKEQTLKLLRGFSPELDRIAGYGASTTTTTLLYNYELEGVIERIYDDNTIKHGTFSPRAHIEVSPSEEIMSRMPRAIVILAWAYAVPIIRRNQGYLEAGGVFVVPLPMPVAIDASTVERFLDV